MKLNGKSGTLMAALTLTALLMVVVLLAAPQREAQGMMLNSQPGFDLMTTGTPGGDEVLIVIDKSTEKMIMYQLNGNRLDTVAAQAFGRLFNGPGGGGGR
jgi:hypothetical protein